MSDPIAYTYDADVRCEDCALERFGRDEHGQISGVDSEGNEVGAIFEWDEVDETRGITCGTCLAEIVEAKPWLVVESSPGYLPESEPAGFGTFDAALEYARELAQDAADCLYGDEDERKWIVTISESLVSPESDVHGDRDGAAFAEISVASDAPHDLGRVISVSLAS